MKGPRQIVDENKRAEEEAFRRWLDKNGLGGITAAAHSAGNALDLAMHEHIPGGSLRQYSAIREQVREAIEHLKDRWRSEAEAARVKGKRNG